MESFESTKFSMIRAWYDFVTDWTWTSEIPHTMKAMPQNKKKFVPTLKNPIQLCHAFIGLRITEIEIFVIIGGKLDVWTNILKNYYKDSQMLNKWNWQFWITMHLWFH